MLTRIGRSGACPNSSCSPVSSECGLTQQLTSRATFERQPLHVSRRTKSSCESGWTFHQLARALCTFARRSIGLRAARAAPIALPERRLPREAGPAGISPMLLGDSRTCVGRQRGRSGPALLKSARPAPLLQLPPEQPGDDGAELARRATAEAIGSRRHPLYEFASISERHVCEAVHASHSG